MAPTPVETSEQIAHVASLWAVKPRPLSPEDAAALSAWLAGDPRRHGALLRAEAGWHSLSRAQALGPSARWQDKAATVFPLPSRRRLLTAAAAGGGLIAASFLAVFALRQDEAITHMGEIRRLPMSDGSIATLNTDSRLRINMAESERRIELIEGEAWFKVAHNRQRPFIVSAGQSRIKAVGTAFSVKKHPDGVEVLVTEGTVQAWSVADDRETVLLNAGERTVLREHQPVKIVHAPDAIDSDLAWREGQIALNGKTLSQVAAEFNRYNRIQIVIEDEALGRERLIGRLSANDPEAFSGAVVEAFGVNIHKTDKAILIGTKK